MHRNVVFAMVVASSMLAIGGGHVAAQAKPDLAGRWSLNRAASEFPTDVGFGMDLLPPGGPDTMSGGSPGRGRRGGESGNLPPFNPSRESEDDAKRREQLTDEVRQPPAHLTVTQTATSITIAGENGPPRTFHPNSQEDIQALNGVPVVTTSRWSGDKLVVRYRVEENRELQCTYSRTQDRLVVVTQFIERGGHGTITRIYQPSKPGEPTSPPPAPRTEAPPQTPPQNQPPSGGLKGLPPPGLPSTGAPQAPPAGQAPAGQTERQNTPIVARGPDAELTGLKRLGVVIEDLSSQAATCGLKQSSIESTVAKSLTGAGLQVMRNGDEDSYVYVRVLTATAGAGLCVSRYDVILYTNTAATLSYQAAPTIVQVSLISKGGISGGAPAAHASSVMQAIKQYADEIATRIHNVNK